MAAIVQSLSVAFRRRFAGVAAELLERAHLQPGTDDRRHRDELRRNAGVSRLHGRPTP